MNTIYEVVNAILEKYENQQNRHVELQNNILFLQTEISTKNKQIESLIETQKLFFTSQNNKCTDGETNKTTKIINKEKIHTSKMQKNNLHPNEVIHRMEIKDHRYQDNQQTQIDLQNKREEDAFQFQQKTTKQQHQTKSKDW